MNETSLHVVGNVVDVPRHNRTTNGSVTNFRLASTSRRWDEETKGFVDGAALFIDVACWGELGGNVVRSISKGDPVVVVGNLLTESWDSDAGRRSANRIKATAVGLNLARGWAEFTRPARAAVRDALRLSSAMTLKNAVAGLPLGGGKGVIMLRGESTLPEERRRAALEDVADAVEALVPGATPTPPAELSARCFAWLDELLARTGG